MSAPRSLDIDTEYDLWLAEQQAIYYGFQPIDEWNVWFLCFNMYLTLFYMTVIIELFERK